MRNFDDSEYLTPDQAASVCCVSVDRFSRWLDSGLIPVIARQGQRLISSQDLIHHLVRHHIPVPDCLLQGHLKKILVIFQQLLMPKAVTAKIIWALYRFREKTSCIIECIAYDSNTELKIITFSPDTILVFGRDEQVKNTADSIRQVLTTSIPLYSFSPTETSDFESVLNRLGGCHG
ncbi:helix-turn-helix domain-containing protein [Desulfogranum japonicum]|uniref:helix-turn-helix domain-containing protein n=1 Tax=Desulfogranum japonicum TaxID=231447 RepID=UPI0003FEB17B|nr:helix-turn-helix domain-containing protein [Desulfogranum japonicum]